MRGTSLLPDLKHTGFGRTEAGFYRGFKFRTKFSTETLVFYFAKISDSGITLCISR